jgi:hypothetical protein
MKREVRDKRPKQRLVRELIGHQTSIAIAPASACPSRTT